MQQQHIHPLEKYHFKLINAVLKERIVASYVSAGLSMQNQFRRLIGSGSDPLIIGTVFHEGLIRFFQGAGSRKSLLGSETLLFFRCSEVMFCFRLVYLPPPLQELEKEAVFLTVSTGVFFKGVGGWRSDLGNIKPAPQPCLTRESVFFPMAYLSLQKPGKREQS